MQILLRCFHLVVLLLLGQSALAAEPPFHGTIFLEKAILTKSDPTTFEKIELIGKAERRMFDRRVDNWIQAEAWLFRAAFDDDQTMEVRVNAEMEQDIAHEHAAFYSEAVGRMPRALRESVRTLTIHEGDQLFGGGGEDILIHVQQGKAYEADGILEETLCHEAAHTSLDDTHAPHERWLAAQQADNQFISTYARDNPMREDVAETFLLYLAYRYKPDRISAELTKTITDTVPNRIKYFDSLQLPMYPIEP